MMVTAINPETIAAELSDDGDTYDLEDGRVIRLRIEPDDMGLLDEQGDGMWCGRIEWDTPKRENAYGWRLRPDGFDGRAEVIETDRNDRLWWQVPTDIEIGSETHQSLRRGIRDLLEYGYRVVVVEVLKGADAYNRPVVVKVASLGGIEPFPDDAYLAEVVRELLDELLAEDET